jgi:hypothetical protein
VPAVNIAATADHLSFFMVLFSLGVMRLQSSTMHFRGTSITIHYNITSPAGLVKDFFLYFMPAFYPPSLSEVSGRPENGRFFMKSFMQRAFFQWFN